MKKTFAAKRERIEREAKALACKSNLTEEDVKAMNALVEEISAIDEAAKTADYHKKTIEGFLSAANGFSEKRSDASGRTIGARFAKSFITSTNGVLSPGQTWAKKDDGDPEPPAGDGVLKLDPDKLGTFGYQLREAQLPSIYSGGIADLFGSEEIEREGVEYLRVSITSADPEPIFDGGHKSRVEYDYDPVTVDINEIGVFTTVTEAMLESESSLSRRIDDTLVGLLKRTEEREILVGNGTRPHFNGILNDPGIQTLDTTSATLVDDLLNAMLMVELPDTDLVADAIIMNKLDWFKLRTLKDENGQYLFGGPAYGPYGNNQVDILPNPWGVPVARTDLIPEGTIIVGACRRGATRYYRTGIKVAVTNSNNDDFEHNRNTLRASRRMGFGIDYPQAFVKLTIGNGEGGGSGN